MPKEISLSDWIGNIFQSKNLSSNIVALYFGYFETKHGYMVYCTGSAEYDDEDPDWACNEDFIPANKYFNPDKALIKLDWMAFEDKMNDSIIEILAAKSSYIPKSIKHICSGFDEEDLTLLWSK